MKLKLWQLAIIVAIIFIVTYDPKSGTLEKFLNSPEVEQPKDESCSSVDYMARHPDHCEDARYDSVQFGTPIETPKRIVPRTEMGVIIG